MDHITVKGTDISIIGIGDQDYISLTDMLKAKGDDVFVADWKQEYCGISGDMGASPQPRL